MISSNLHKFIVLQIFSLNPEIIDHALKHQLDISMIIENWTCHRNSRALHCYKIVRGDIVK